VLVGSGKLYAGIRQILQPKFYVPANNRRGSTVRTACTLITFQRPASLDYSLSRMFFMFYWNSSRGRISMPNRACRGHSSLPSLSRIWQGIAIFDVFRCTSACSDSSLCGILFSCIKRGKSVTINIMKTEHIKGFSRSSS